MELTGDAVGSYDSIVGEECHIISKVEGGPRSYRLYPSVGYSDLDVAENLLLLCPTHHRLVDVNPEQFSLDLLQGIKASHESWVQNQLSEDGEGATSLVILPRLHGGRDVYSVVGGSMALAFDNSELETEAEVDLVADFRQHVGDLLDIFHLIEPGDLVRYQFEMSKMVTGLERSGLRIFGLQQRRRATRADPSWLWETAILLVVRVGSPGVLSDAEGEEIAISAMLADM